MNFYLCKIKPISMFGTIPKGDTIFGRICWEIVYNKGEGELQNLLSDYEKSPFLVTSSFYPLNSEENVVYLKTPSLPLNKLYSQEQVSNENVNIKDLKKKKYIELKLNTSHLSLNNSNQKYSEQELETKGIIIKTYRYTHNTINRITFTTSGGEMFSPFDEIYYYYSSELSLFVAIDEGKIKKDEFNDLLKKVGLNGFGKDSSIGYGKFEVSDEIRKINFDNNAELYYALSPFIPEKENDEIYFTPFVRYGKHGDPISKQNLALKKPIIMADEGSVIKNSNIKNFIYGKAIKEISNKIKSAVSQGYTICLPIKE